MMEPALNGDGDRGLARRNDHMWDKQRGISSEVLGEGQVLGSSVEDDSRINEVAKDVDNLVGGQIQVHSDQLKAQRKFQGPVLHWDRFLPTRSLKVLLVENDDSTRHVLSALLRNCSYEVTAVADGLQAWKILQDVTNHFDLVLTEVVVPLTSGISLLYKNMSHNSFKNIPVIMMSSHDSMSIVFKCFSKGAVDFLVKPIRKNELKNLWQHVWRRCHSSSGSTSESGTQTKRSTESKRNGDSENNTGISAERENERIGMSVRDGSDDGSGAQGSWTKKAAEVDSPKPTSYDQLTDAPDSTCAQVTLTNPEIISNRWVHATEANGFQEKKKVLDNVAMGKDLKIGISRKLDFQLEYQVEQFSTHPTSKRQKKMPEVLRMPFDKGLMGENRDNFSGDERDKAADTDSATINCTKPRGENRGFEACNGVTDIPSIKGKAGFDSGYPPSLEPSLKRLREAGDLEINALDERNVLRRSDMSAFSRYTTGPSTNQSNTLLNQHSNGSIVNNALACSDKHVIPKLEPISNKSEPMSVHCHSTAFQPVQNSCAYPPLQVKSERADDLAVTVVKPQSKSPRQQIEVQHHHHHYHLYHHHVYDVQQQDPDDLSHKTMAAAASQCGSSNAIGGGPMMVNGGNDSVNGSASGSSNTGSNGEKGSSITLNGGGKKMEIDNAIAGNSRAGRLSGKNGAEENRIVQRKAALNKFRQKRKERCFEKKVRYQNRKKLAEQRPRIRGQFVRQMVADGKAGQDNESNNCLSEGNSSNSVQ